MGVFLWYKLIYGLLALYKAMFKPISKKIGEIKNKAHNE